VQQERSLDGFVVPSVNRRMTASQSRGQPSISQRIEARMAAAREATLAEEDALPASSQPSSLPAASSQYSSSLPASNYSPLPEAQLTPMGSPAPSSAAQGIELPFEESAML